MTDDAVSGSAARTRRVVVRFGLGAVAALLVGVGIVAFLLSRDGHDTQLRRVCRNSYCVSLPASWRYHFAGYEGDHATDFYWDPENALRQLTIVNSGCVGCVTKDADGVTADPSAALPLNALNVREVSPFEVRYRTLEGRSPYPTEGFVYVIRGDEGIEGMTIFELDLPATERTLAQQVIESFARER